MRNYNLASVFDVEAWTKGVVVDATALEVVNGFAVISVDSDRVYASRRGEGAEREVRGLIVVRIASIFQIFACANVLQGESFAINIVDVPHSTVLHVLAIAFRQSEDETAPACLDGLRIQITWFAPDVILLVVRGDESQQVATSHRALLQFEEIAGVAVVEGGGIVFVA